MNEKFFQLPVEKQRNILNAAFEVFGKYEYKKASTEEIAFKAGISKGLLFHYFQNKKSLYMYLMDYSFKIIKEQIVNTDFTHVTEFFELLEYSTKKKVAIIEENPYITEFTIRAYYSQNESISEELQEKMKKESDIAFSTYFQHVNFEKYFKDTVNLRDIFNMLAWMTDGYLHEKQRVGISIQVDDLMKEYRKWSKVLKQISYKEEYLS